MNSKITRALSDNHSGDIMEYFNEVDKIVQLNDGIHDCKILSMECYDRPTPVKYNQYTKFHLSDAGVDCVNIDKSYITATMTYHMKLTKISSTSITNTDQERQQLYKMFVGLKNASQNFDTYRIYINHNQVYSQTDSIYEQTLTTALKPKPEMYRPNMYSMWDEVHKHSQNVCGVYFDIYGKLGQEFDITFEVSIQLDDLLPLSGMSILPTCVIGDIELEIKNRIQGNLVYCQVNPNAIYNELVSTGSNIGGTIGGTASSKRATTADVKSELSTALYNKEFTQVGDPTWVCVHNYGASTSGASETVGFAQNIKVLLECTNSIMNNAMSHINGFRLKDSVISQLKSKYSSKPLIIPAQVCKHDLFAQRPTAGGLKLNTNITLTNCTNIALSFPQTDNEISVVKNPEQQAAQLILMGKNIPDKSINTLEAAHTEMELTNASLDSLFEAQPSFIRSLTISASNGTSKINRPEDATDYYFNVSLERFGNGVYCDGITSPGAITLTFQSNSINTGAADPYYHPDIDDSSVLNTQPINIMSVQDCFWIITPSRAVLSADVYTPEITETA